LALSIAVSSVIGSVSVYAADTQLEAYSVVDETYNFRDTEDLEASFETSSTGDEVLTLTWPAVDKEGKLIKANPLKSTSAYGNPMGSWTNPTQGMIINYEGWNIAGNNTKPKTTNTGNEEILLGLTSTPTDYPMVILDAKDSSVRVGSAYLSNDVVTSAGFATAYIVEYSKDGVNFKQDHIASGINHGRKLVHENADGTLSTDGATTYFLRDQLVEELTDSLEANTEYTIRVTATNAAKTTEVYKVFETKVTTPAGKEKTPAFASVEGSGTYSQGGRGGDVYVVTNLTDSVDNPQPGSLRYGLLRKDRADGNTTAPRTIVFAVGGTIQVDETANKSARRMNVTSNTTILGQTAPGEGITVAGASMKFNGSNIIVRYMTFRLGEGYDADAATATGQYIVIDHCTFAWGVDEVFSAKEILNSSIQYNIIASGLAMPNKNGALNTDPEIASGESEVKHGMGSILNGYEVSYTHNLWAHNGTRNPRFEGGFTYNNVRYENKIDYSNNVVYDWGHNSTYGGERGNGQMNIVGNYYKPGPETLEKVKYQLFQCDSASNYIGSYYVDGNKMTSSAEVTADNKLGLKGEYKELKTSVDMAIPYEAESADSAYANVLASAGASRLRDPQDARLMYEVENGKGSFVNSEAEAGGWDDTVFASDITDSDGDGLPDEFETKFGLNPNDASDSCKIIEDETSKYNGYSYIEVYAGNLVNDWNDSSAVSNNTAPTAQISAITDESGNDVLAAMGNTVLVSGKSYTVTLSEPVTATLYLNDEAVADYKDNKFVFTPNEVGVYKLACLMGSVGSQRSFSLAVPVTVMKGEGNLEGFTSIDLGAVGAAGADLYDEATGTLYTQGSGRVGITNTTSTKVPDSCHYDYTTVSGDFDISAKIDNLAKVDTMQKSGIMVRASLDPESEMYMAAFTYLKGEDFEGDVDVMGESVKAKNIRGYARLADGDATSSYKFLSIPTVREGAEPNYGYARIIREGNTITLYASRDGEGWMILKEITSDTLPETCYVGFATEAAQDTSEKIRSNATAFSEISFENTDDATLLGDANCDGKVTADDAAYVLQYVLTGDSTLMTEQGFKNARVLDRDTYSAQTSAYILQKTLDSSFRFPVEK
jgi:hypothetical protein